MSAYIQGKEHIDALLRVGLEGPTGRDVWHSLSWWTGEERHELTRENVDAIGAVLTAENARSVQYRYPDDGMDTLAGPTDNGFVTDALLGRYAYQSGYGTGPVFIGQGPRHLSAVEALKAINGYEYQSCEHPAWETSGAKAFCEALRRAVEVCLPGYEEADTWSI